MFTENQHKAGVATVVNFPLGTSTVDEVIAETKTCLNEVDEIDLVWPFEKYASGDKEGSCHMISEIKKVISKYNEINLSRRNPIRLKVILETAAIPEERVYEACLDAVHASADFLKTSTGKHPAGGATLEVAYEMLQAIKDIKEKEQLEIGLKISGGVRTTDQAASYIWLAQRLMTGSDEELSIQSENQRWVNTKNFRIGASSVFGDLVAALKPDEKFSMSSDQGY